MGSKLGEIFVLQGVLGTNPFLRIVSKEFDQDVFKIVSTSSWQKFLHTDSLLRGEVYLHMGGLTSEPLQNLLLWGAEDIMDAVDLIELIFPRKQRLFGDEFEKHATETPNVHFFVIVAIGHEALRSPVPSSGDVVSVGGGRMFAFAGA